MESLAPEVLRSAIASLALGMQTSANITLMSNDDASNHFINFFTDIEGFSLPEAKKYSRLILPHSKQVIGVLSEASPSGELQFLHRIFQEFLAAEHLNKLPISEQTKLCQKHIRDVEWHRVISFLLQKNNRPDDVQFLIKAMEEVDLGISEQRMRKLLIAEAIFLNVRLDPKDRTKRAIEILDEIESETWLPWREALLSQVFLASPGSNVFLLLIERMKLWTPMCQSLHWGNGLCEAIAEWPLNTESEETLWRLVTHEEISVQLKAAMALARRSKGDVQWKKRFISRLQTPLCPESLGVCLVALAVGWISDSDVIELCKSAVNSSVSEIVVAAVYGLVLAGEHSEAIKRRFLDHCGPFWFDKIVIESVLKGWPQDREILDLAINSVSRSRSSVHKNFQNDAALKILIEGYPGEDSVAEYLSEELDGEYFSFDHLVNLNLLLKGFSGHKRIVDAAERWLERNKEKHLHHVPIVAALAHTDRCKKLLIEQLLIPNAYCFLALDCLVKGWGEEDPEVEDALIKVSEKQELVDQVAVILATTAKDKNSCLQLIRKCFTSSKENLRVDNLLEAISILENTAIDDEVIEISIKNVTADTSDLFVKYGRKKLIEKSGSHPRVKNLLNLSPHVYDCDLAQVALAYGADDQIRKRVTDQCRCLSKSLRLMIANYCRQFAAYDETVHEIARRLLVDCECDVRVVAAITLAEVNLYTGKDSKELTEFFEKEVVAVGMDYEMRHEVGVAGLIALEKLDRLKSCKRADRENVGIHFNYSIHDRGVLPSYIVRKWDYVRSVLGSDIWENFHNENDLFQLRKAAKAMGIFKITDECADALLSKSQKTPYILQIMAEKQAYGWVEMCFSAMGLSTETSSIRTVECNDAIRLISKYGRTDSSIQPRLEACVKSQSHWKANAIEALARGWPDSVLLKELWEKASDESELINLNNWLVCLFASSDKFISWLRNWLSSIANKSSYHNLSRDRWFIMRRCFQDKDVSIKLMRILQDDPTADEIASFVWLVHGNSDKASKAQLLLWAKDKIKSIKADNWSYIGFDIFQSEMVSLKQALFELVMTDRRYQLN